MGLTGQGAKVELFGSFANTFTIANSDIDCCVTDAEATSSELQTSGLPEKLQAHLNALGGYETTLLTQTRIPILKVFRPATLSLVPDGTSAVYKYPLHCDVGWQNRLALHNTRLLRAYSALDPRLREIALFVKYWTKTRVIARPRYGTLCSYGYVLMIIFFLTNVVRPAVLPNLQCLPRQGRVRIEDIECEGCNISFSDGMGWKSDNKQATPPLGRTLSFASRVSARWTFPPLCVADVACLVNRRTYQRILQLLRLRMALQKQRHLNPLALRDHHEGIQRLDNPR